MDEKKVNKKLSDDEYFVIDVLKYLGAKGDTALIPFILLNEKPEMKEERIKKLIKYIKFKGKYITEQDIYKKCFQITTPREQYYPCEMYVKYIGETTKQLTKDNIYHVRMVFDDDEYYLIVCDDNSSSVFSCELFEIQKISTFIYKGSKDEDGRDRISEGFIVGEKYDVLSFETGKYICTNGYECWLDEVTPLEFIPKEFELPIPFEDIDDALKLLKDALEFGTIRELSKHIHPECKYISYSSNKEFYNKKDIVKHLQKISSVQLREDIFIDCVLATIIEAEEPNMFSVGDRCFAIYEEGGCKNVVFVTLSDDMRCIKGIYIFNDYYRFEIDE